MARSELASVSDSGRQDACDRLLAAERACTGLAHGVLAHAFDLRPVHEPRAVLSLDVDGVLETETSGFTTAGLAGVAALKLLELGKVAVLLNTARSFEEVRDRVEQFRLLGGVANLGAVTWDAIFGRRHDYLTETAALQLHRLRSELRHSNRSLPRQRGRVGRGPFTSHGPDLDGTIVLHRQYEHCVRASAIVKGNLVPIPAPAARRLLEDYALDHLTFLIANRYTDFVDRSMTKATGLERLREAMGLSRLPLAAMGDSTCDLPMLRLARNAFLPAHALPSYVPNAGQRCLRLRGDGGAALWSAALRLVPDVHLGRRVLSMASAPELPEWLPARLREPIRAERWALSRLAAAFVGRPGPGRVPLTAKGES